MSGPGFGGAGSSTDDGYRFRNYEKASLYVYVGYEHPSGPWFVARRTISSGAREVASGNSSYSTSWTGRAGLSYA